MRKNKLKIKILVILITIVLAFSAVSCSNGLSETANITQNQATTQTDAIKEEDSTLENSQSQQQSSTAFTSTTAKSVLSTTATTQKSTTKTTTTKTSTTQSQKLTISLTVNCKTAVEKGILKQEGYNKIIPVNGIFYENSSVEFSAGQTAFEVLKETLKEQGIIFNYRRDYIRGIGGLNEKDAFCGPSSGWVYRVNGEFLKYAASQYKLKNGDKVEFLFTCENGDLNAVL